MASNYLSVYGVAIAACCLAVGFDFLYQSYVHIGLDVSKVPEETFVVALVGAVVPMLLLLGIIKKWSWLVLPSILAVVSVAVYLAFGGFGVKTWWASRRFYDYMNIFLQIAIEVTLLYPLCHLFAELRRTNVAIKKHHTIQPTSETIVVKTLI